MAYNTDAARWRALATRDVNANGLFVYSVRSTNIYCRPTCPARLARRANVGFYESPLQAEADGFRACKRCKPNTILEDPQERAVERACVLIDEAVKKDDSKALRLHDLAKNVRLTPRYFHKIFKDKMGVTPKEWAKTRATQPSCSSETPALTVSATASPPGGVEDEIADWNSFNFNELVDFDIDGSATLGYNLTTGAAEPVSMGHGNAIDMSILHELWMSGYEPDSLDVGNFLGDENLMGAAGDASAHELMWPIVGKQMPVTSTFELDADALLRCDSVLF
jgi:methylphosphotriester-DNA--protein-cysteine methyltransferase